MNYYVLGGFTVFWFIVGGIIPCFIPRGPSKGVTQVSLALTAVCCWLLWFCTYLAQDHPLVGPKLSKNSIMAMSREWGNPIKAG